MTLASFKHLPAACFAEFCAMAIFIIFGCGGAMGLDGNREGDAGTGMTSKAPSWVVMVSLVFGLAITMLVYSTAHISGGHINCAVTFGLVLSGQCHIVSGLCYFVAQMCGAVVGALLLMIIYPAEMDKTSGLGSNGLSDGWDWSNAFVGEIVGTCLLMLTVLQTAVNPAAEANRAQAPLAIGFAVFVAHCILIPIDGCSINPTRSFGPALVAQFRYGGEKSPFSHMWIFWAGPLIGSLLAVAVYAAIRAVTPADAAEKEQEKQQLAEAAGQEATA